MVTIMKTREQLKQAALSIFQAGLKAVDPYEAVRNTLSVQGTNIVLKHPGGGETKLDGGAYKRVVIVGGGKATARMSQAVEEILGERVTEGLINVKYGHTADNKRVEVVQAGHPIPDEAGLGGAQRMLALLEGLGEDALVFCLLSGGGSALLPLPAKGINLAEKQQLTGLLLEAGADIGEINSIRKHMSGLKGGQLARAASPATVVNLILSDVVGDRLDVIASGPTVPDESSFADAKGVLERYGIWDKAPESIRLRFAAGVAGDIPDTPKAGDPSLARCTNIIIGGNLIALRACEAAARQQGLNALVLSSTVEGETREVARMHAAIGREIMASGLPVAAPACIITGGETTVTIKGSGKGGRNQEFALAAALDIAGEDRIAVLCGGTDGNDGPTDAAGAIAFGDTVARAQVANLSARAHLDNNDAYPLFDTIGDLIKTGPTGTNVMDVRLVLISE